MNTVGHRKIVARMRAGHPERAEALEAVAFCSRPGVHLRQLLVMCAIVAVAVAVVPGGSSIGTAALAGGLAAGVGVGLAVIVINVRSRRSGSPGALPSRFLLALTPDHLLVISTSASGKPQEVLEEIPRWAFRLEAPENKFQTLRFVLVTNDGRRRPAEGQRSTAMAPNARAMETIAAAGAPLSG